MRLPKTAHTSRPWRIHELTGLRLEDVWALPTPGGPGDFLGWCGCSPRATLAGSSRAARTLFAIRWKVGELRLGRPGRRPRLGGADASRPVADRASRRAIRPGLRGTPFTPLYLVDDEFAAEIAKPDRSRDHSHRLGPGRDGGYRGEMAVYVKPNGLLGNAYMAAIAPFRHLIVYPPMLREMGRNWRGAPASRRPAHAGVTDQRRYVSGGCRFSEADPVRGGCRWRKAESRRSSVPRCLNRHDVEAIMDFFTDDCVLEMPRGHRSVGAPARRQGAGCVEGIAARLAGSQTSITAMTATGLRRARRSAVDDHRHRYLGCGGRGPGVRPLRASRREIVRKDSYWKMRRSGR